MVRKAEGKGKDNAGHSALQEKAKGITRAEGTVGRIVSSEEVMALRGARQGVVHTGRTV